MRAAGAADVAYVLDRVSRDGLRRLVTRLAGELEAHDRAAELMRQHVSSAGEHLAHWYERRSSTVFTG